ncbi:MAG: hypothetical protein M1820_010223 [Bogoriella megaspora]|nr:MAG: hypothetical protein M1820_010223 [Bogoriella megaspora]
MPSFRRNPTTAFKLASAVFIICFYLIYATFRDYFSPSLRVERVELPRIQYEGWRGGGKADLRKAGAVKEAMRITFASYQKRAWGKDEIHPVSGGNSNKRNGWGAFLLESSTTLAVMELWDELREAVRHIIDKVDFTTTDEIVNTSEATLKYLGALLSLVDMSDAGHIPEDVVSQNDRNTLLGQAYTLAYKLTPAYYTDSGMPWPRVDFETSTGVLSPLLGSPDKAEEDSMATIELADVGASIVEYRILSRLTNEAVYLEAATSAWASLVWPNYNISALPNNPTGLFPSPLEIHSGLSVGHDYGWDANHAPFYNNLLKSYLIAPHSQHSPKYRDTWLAATHALRWNLTSRSADTSFHKTHHLYLAQRTGPHFLNEASQTSCAAPGHLILGGAATSRPDLISLGQALLEGCHHIHASSPSGLAPSRWSWLPAAQDRGEGLFTPSTARAQRQLDIRGWWAVDESYRLRPEYVESLFYAFRITGQQRYRDWAWQLWEVVERRCKAQYGYSGIRDVMRAKVTSSEWGVVQQAVRQAGVEMLDEQDTVWMARTLKFFWLVFADVKKVDLDAWVVSEGGHLFRRTEPG